jgi:hypothetical protein
MRWPYCLSLRLYINFWITEPIFVELTMYIIVPEPISTAYFINSSHQSVSLYMQSPIVSRQRLGKNITAENGYTPSNRRIVGRVVFYAIRVVWKESRRLVLPWTSCFDCDALWKFFFFQWLFQPVQGPGLLFSSVIILSQTVGLLGLVISPSQGRYLNTGQHNHRISAYTYKTSMPWMGFEPTFPAPERAKTVHASDGAATVTGMERLVQH